MFDYRFFHFLFICHSFWMLTGLWFWPKCNQLPESVQGSWAHRWDGFSPADFTETPSLQLSLCQGNLKRKYKPAFCVLFLLSSSFSFFPHRSSLCLQSLTAASLQSTLVRWLRARWARLMCLKWRECPMPLRSFIWMTSTNWFHSGYEDSECLPVFWVASRPWSH